MGTLAFKDRTVNYQWASDVDFDGIRLEMLSSEGGTLFDVSILEGGPITINTFGNEVAVELIEAAIEIARRPR